MGLFIPQFDHVILLSAPTEVIVQRLTTRTNNPFGKDPRELEQVLALIQTIEPLLRKTAGHEIDTDKNLEDIITEMLRIAQE